MECGFCYLGFPINTNNKLVAETYDIQEHSSQV